MNSMPLWSAFVILLVAVIVWFLARGAAKYFVRNLPRREFAAGLQLDLEMRKTFFTFTGGILAALAAYATWSSLQLQRQQFEFQRAAAAAQALTEAASNLSHAELESRVAAVHALEQLSREHREAVVQVLSTLLRNSTRVRFVGPNAVSLAEDGPYEHRPLTPDIQAAVDVLVEIGNRAGDNLRLDLTSAVLSGAQFRDADLTKLIAPRATFDGARLEHARLSWSVLCDAGLTDARLRCANLSCADLSNADLSGADLANVRLWGANLSGTKLLGARNLTQSQLDESCADNTPEIADTLHPPPACVKPAPVCVEKPHPAECDEHP